MKFVQHTSSYSERSRDSSPVALERFLRPRGPIQVSQERHLSLGNEGCSRAHFIPCPCERSESV